MKLPESAFTNLLAIFIFGHKLRTERSYFHSLEEPTLTEISSLRIEDWLSSEPGIVSTILCPLRDGLRQNWPKITLSSLGIQLSRAQTFQGHLIYIQILQASLKIVF